MKVKLDQNLPGRLVRELAAQSAGRFLITQDLDFSDVRRYTPERT